MKFTKDNVWAGIYLKTDPLLTENQRKSLRKQIFDMELDNQKKSHS